MILYVDYIKPVLCFFGPVCRDVVVSHTTPTVQKVVTPNWIKIEKLMTTIQNWKANDDNTKLKS